MHLLRTRAMPLSILMLVLGAVSMTALHVGAHPELSPVDELQHIDYLYKAPAVVHSGETVGQDAMREQACRGLATWPQTAACSTSATYDPADFQEGGNNTAAIYTPLYYSVTKALALPIKAVTGLDSLVTAGRLVGGLWLAGGLVMALLAARRLGAHPYVATAVLLAAASTPAVLLPAATITPDAAALLGGAALLWSILWWQDSPGRRWWLPMVLAAAVVALKALNILIVVVVALYVLLRAVVDQVQRRRDAGAVVTGPRPAQAAGLIGAMSVLALGMAIGYIAYTGVSAVADTSAVAMTERTTVDSFPLRATVEHLGVFVNVFFDAGSWNTMDFVGALSQRLLGLMTVGGVFGAIFVLRDASRTLRLTAISLLVVGTLGAPMIMAFSYLSQGIAVPIPGRYALSLIPAGVAVTAAAIRGRTASWAIAAIGFGCWALSMAFLIDS
ncbi:hypothetical protein [Cellulomonas sp. NPDC089187]|uniref:hypothetical protein n=1 Tax=Cellulomonas sp. NPDC089187 TaxID=3154970 RepID=UPI00342985E7